MLLVWVVFIEQPWVAAAGIVARAGGGYALLQERRGQIGAAVLAPAIAGFGSTQLLLAGFEPIGQARAGTRRHAHAAGDPGRADARVTHLFGGYL